MRFLVDSQLPQLLAKRLCEAGYESRHVLEIALSQSPDDGLRLAVFCRDVGVLGVEGVLPNPHP